VLLIIGAVLPLIALVFAIYFWSRRIEFVSVFSTRLPLLPVHARRLATFFLGTVALPGLTTSISVIFQMHLS